MKTRQEKKEESAMIAVYSFVILILIVLILGCINFLSTV